MSDPGTILISIEGAVANLALNRPEVQHAMNMEMIREVAGTISRIGNDENIRMIVLRAPGANFSAGADLNWMRNGMKQPESQLLNESMELAGLFRLIRETPKIFITAVRGLVLGGANGLVAASDLVIAENTARFIFSEVKLGLVPATIAPFVVRKAGKSRTAAWMLSGRPVSAQEACLGGLVHFLCEEGSLEEQTRKLLNELLSNGPEAMKGIKQMLQNFDFGQDPLQIQESTAEILARYRISAEGQEGMDAFFEKRKPGWYGNL